MNFLQAMQERYTTKVYDAHKKIDAKDIAELKEILRLSPSSINSQPWKFLFIEDAELKGKLAEKSYFNEEKIKNASCLVVFMVKSVAQFEKEFQDYLSEGAIDYYQGKFSAAPEITKERWMERQVYIALGILLSACAVKGIDTTTMEGIQPSEYDEVLQIDGYKTIVAVALGGRDEENDYNQLHLSPKQRRNEDLVIKHYK
uniref:NAD(P)H-dependent oxidoreductase n=1 Tax=Ornithobacterium rhinotracheale TaxID=28251 RepID=UPI0039A4D365